MDVDLIRDLQCADLFKCEIKGSAVYGLMLDPAAMLVGFLADSNETLHMSWCVADHELRCTNYGSKWVLDEYPNGSGAITTAQKCVFSGDEALILRFSAESNSTETYLFNRLSRQRLHQVPPTSRAILRWAIWRDLSHYLDYPTSPMVAVQTTSTAH
jgi:hypothetical protein